MACVHGIASSGAELLISAAKGPRLCDDLSLLPDMLDKFPELTRWWPGWSWKTRRSRSAAMLGSSLRRVLLQAAEWD
jgi:hypothetical protein